MYETIFEQAIAGPLTLILTLILSFYRYEILLEQVITGSLTLIQSIFIFYAWNQTRLGMS